MATQSQRGVTYTATAIDPAGAPVLGFDPTRTADVTGAEQTRQLAVHAQAPAGSQHPVQLTTTPHGPAWQVMSGPYRDYLVPYHHPSWSVNPPGTRTPA
jgi:hypothetical protein